MTAMSCNPSDALQPPRSMVIVTLCAVVASLSVIPNRSQFFQYESVSLSCGQHGHSSEWRVKRNTSMNINEDCPSSWNRGNQSHCFINNLYKSDSGVYWCESGAGAFSNTVKINVTVGVLILESPALPVNEGEAVTLRCRHKKTSSSDLTHFYKDERLIGSSLSGNLTIERVSRSDEGLYKCNISGEGESLESCLTVRGLPEPPHVPPAHNVVLPVIGLFLSLAVALLFCVRGNHQDECVQTIVLYSHISGTQRCHTKGHQQRKPIFSMVVYRPVPASPDPLLNHRVCDYENVQPTCV